MKKNTNSKSNGNASHPVRIEFTHPGAKAVFLAGSFNDWRPASTPMIALDQGHWAKELALSPGRYEYLLVVDEQWMTDPLARETAPNPYGGANSVLIVPPTKVGSND